MYLEKKEDLSFYYFVQNSFSAYPDIKIVYGFPKDTLTLPSISVYSKKLTLQNFELGNRSGLRLRRYIIDIFANTDTQRDEFGYKILNELDNGVLVYDYDVGFPPSVTPPVIEHLNMESRTMDIIDIRPELVDKLYYRATLTIVAKNDTV